MVVLIICEMKIGDILKGMIERKEKWMVVMKYGVKFYGVLKEIIVKWKHPEGVNVLLGLFFLCVIICESIYFKV